MKKNIILVFFVFSSLTTLAQLGINTDNSTPDTSAMLDVKSTSKGFLPPRMTTVQQNAITSPVAGLIIFNTEAKTLNIFNGTAWVQLVPLNMIWNCGDNFNDPRDNTSYGTVQIGTQCWMKSNLNIGTRINASTNQTNNGIIEKYCFNDQTANCSIYGGMYQWDELMNYTPSVNGVPADWRGLCPVGWHVPSDSEWGILIAGAGGAVLAGGPLKETGTAHWLPPNGAATNSTGFTALGGGAYYPEISTFGQFGQYAIFYTSTENSPTTVFYRTMRWSDGDTGYGTNLKTRGYSCRCIKD